MRARTHPADDRGNPTRREHAVAARRDLLRGRRRDRVPALPAGLEAGNAPCKPQLSAEPAVAAFLRPPDRRHRRAGGPELVRFAPSRHRSPPTGPCRCCPSSCGRRNGWALRPEGTNPGRGIRRYRRKGRERFLSDDEIRRLSQRLTAHATRCPLQVAIIRLLLLTGCRKSEIMTLRWSDYREGHLFLRDSKTGPRTVWLSQPARNVSRRA